MSKPKELLIVPRGNYEIKNRLKTQIDVVDGKPMKYQDTGITRMYNGILFDVYELIPTTLIQNKHIFYVRRNDEVTKNNIKSRLVVIDGKPMKYMITGTNQLHGIKYDIYELCAVSYSKFWCCIKRNRSY